MGACLSCLGLGSSGSSDERTRLLSDDPYSNPYGTHGGPQSAQWGQGAPPPQNVLSPEEARREREAMDNIMRWASDQIVEIFPHGHNQKTAALQQQLQNGGITTNGNGLANSTTSLHHQDILLNMIPGDKSKRSIRIYPASRPTSQDANSVKSKASQTNLKFNGTGSTRSQRSGVYVKLNVDLP